MKKIEYKLFPCIVCSIGFNAYAVANNLTTSAVSKFKISSKEQYDDELSLVNADSNLNNK